MALNSTSNRDDYTGNGATNAWAVTKRFFANTDLFVYVDSALGIPELKTHVTHYTVSGAGSQTGGTVTFTLGNTPANGRHITILRIVELKQPTQYPPNNKFSSAAHEAALDRVVMQIQQLSEKIGRQPVLPVNWTGGELTLPYGSSVAGQSFRWNGTGTALELFTPSSAGLYADPITTKGDLLAGNAAGISSRLPVGVTDFMILEVDAAETQGLKWTGLDTILGRKLTTRGDILTRDAVGVVRKAKGARGSIFSFDANDPVYVAKGARGAILSADANDLLWTAAGTKGQILSPDANADLGFVSVGADGTALVARSAETRGLKFVQLAGQTFRDLFLRTHPSNDQALTKVYLQKAAEIVMDDGEQVLDWSNLTADITVAGAGGLDTGTEAGNGASVWYQIYAIRKRSDGTKNLLLHRAKDYFEDEVQDTSDTAALLRNAAGNQRLAQGFQVDTAGPCEFVWLHCRKVGAPTGNVWVQIEGDSSGSPDGVALATSDKIDVAKFDTNNWKMPFVFRAPATLSALTQYHIVLYGDFAVSGVNHFEWPIKNNTNPYARGSAKSYDGANWNAVGTTADFRFAVYITRNDTAVTMPTGYDQKALIGWVFNNSTSDFVPFQAVNKKVRATNGGPSMATLATSSILLTNLLTFVPPTPVDLTHSFVGQNTGAIAICAFPIRDWNLTSNSAANLLGGGATNMYIGAAGQYGVFGPVRVEYQRAIYYVGSESWTPYSLMYEW